MPLPWNIDVARTYWSERSFYIVNNSPNASFRNSNYLQSRQNRFDQSETDLTTLWSQLNLPHNASNSTLVVSSLECWCKTLSWTKCKTCNSVHSEKLRPSFKKLQKCHTQVICQYHDDKYVVPLIQQIPLELRHLSTTQIKALRPFDIDSKQSVEQKILNLDSEDDRQMCSVALKCLLHNSSSSYKHFYDRREQLVNSRQEPSLFDVYRWNGIECALWKNLYPFTSWCDTINDGCSDRQSWKISFLTKCSSSIVDYSLNFDLLSFHFQRWLYKTIMGAIQTSHNNSQETVSAFQALQDKPFSKGYWDWQHRYLIDAVAQFGLPLLFIIISPSEWNFQLKFLLEDICEQTGYSPTNLAFFETIHFLPVLEQIVRGYLCGSNDSNLTNHLLSYNHSKKQSNIKTYFYHFEFKQRGTLHIHCLIWLKNFNYIEYKHIRADLPQDDPNLLYYVRKCQIADKSSLPISALNTHVDNSADEPVLKISHPPSAHDIGLHAYVQTLLPVLKSSMDVQTTNGKQMLLKYVSPYVCKAKESFHNDVLYCSTLPPSITAFKYAMSLDIAAPEMWVLLLSRKISWTNASRKKLAIPSTPEIASDNSTIAKYYNWTKDCEHLSLLKWLRLFNECEAIPTQYPQDKVVLVGLKFLSVFNPAYFFQYSFAHYPHRALTDILPSNDTNPPSQIYFFNEALSLMPDTFNDGRSFASQLEVNGHRQYFLDTIAFYLQSLVDLDNTFRKRLLPHTHSSANHTAFTPTTLALTSNQLVFYTYFKQIMEARKQFLPTNMALDESRPDWKRFPMVLAKPGTGKFFAFQQCIASALQNGLTTCVATPAGTLACTYKDLYSDAVTCDTIHSIFQFKSHATTVSSINSHLSQYDVIFIDEISQVSVALFHHLINTINVLNRRPILVHCCDFCQQQPLATKNGKTIQAKNILSCQHCHSHVLTFTLT